MSGAKYFTDEESYPNVSRGYRYAKDVKDGKISVCVYVKNCINRFFSDLHPSKPFYFDPDAAERYLRLVQKFKHVKGNNWKSEYIVYEPWQNFVFMVVMGFMLKSTKRRRFRTAYVEVPRGNGKSAISSQAGLYFLSLDGELGPEIICAATKKDQARIVLDSSRIMAKKNKGFCEATKTRVLAHKIIHDPSDGDMRSVASDSTSLDGLNPSLIIGDETHEWKRNLYDVLDSSTAKRDNSLFFMISTAGLSTETIGHENHIYTKRVLLGEVEDDTWFGIIYTIDEKDNWQDKKAWEKANPNWKVSVDPRNFEAKAKKAQETPASKRNFLVKHLNQWQNAASPFFNIEKFRQCARKIKLSDFSSKHCWVGLDLSSKVDLCSISYVFKENDKLHGFCKGFLPEARIDDNKNVKYQRWADEGHLTVMPGEVINFEEIQNIIIADSKIFKFIGLHADPWSANETIQRLIKARIDAIEFRMSTQNLSEPTKKLDALIRTLDFLHDGSPLFDWCISNVVCKEDANENVFPRKEHQRFKIDLALSTIMAIAGFVADEQKKSVYEDRGLIVI